MNTEKAFLKNLRHDEWFQFFTEFKALAEAQGTATMNCEPQFGCNGDGGTDISFIIPLGY